MAHSRRGPQSYLVDENLHAKGARAKSQVSVVGGWTTKEVQPVVEDINVFALENARIAIASHINEKDILLNMYHAIAGMVVGLKSAVERANKKAGLNVDDKAVGQDDLKVNNDNKKFAIPAFLKTLTPEYFQQFDLVIGDNVTQIGVIDIPSVKEECLSKSFADYVALFGSLDEKSLEQADKTVKNELVKIIQINQALKKWFKDNEIEILKLMIRFPITSIISKNSYLKSYINRSQVYQTFAPRIAMIQKKEEDLDEAFVCHVDLKKYKEEYRAMLIDHLDKIKVSFDKAKEKLEIEQKIPDKEQKSRDETLKGKITLVNFRLALLAEIKASFQREKNPLHQGAWTKVANFLIEHDPLKSTYTHKGKEGKNLFHLLLSATKFTTRDYTDWLRALYIHLNTDRNNFLASAQYDDVVIKEIKELLIEKMKELNIAIPGQPVGKEQLSKKRAGHVKELHSILNELANNKHADHIKKLHSKLKEQEEKFLAFNPQSSTMMLIHYGLQLGNEMTKKVLLKKIKKMKLDVAQDEVKQFADTEKLRELLQPGSSQDKKGGVKGKQKADSKASKKTPSEKKQIVLESSRSSAPLGQPSATSPAVKNQLLSLPTTSLKKKPEERKADGGLGTVQQPSPIPGTPSPASSPATHAIQDKLPPIRKKMP